MHKLKSLFFVVSLSLLLPFVINAQNNSTNSPYARYGYGKLSDKTFGSQRGMGGIGIGLRNPQMINPANPASFSGVDSMTFMLDLGVSLQTGSIQDGNNKSQKTTGGLDYLAIQVPLAKRFGLGLGFEPISSVGYNYGASQELGIGDITNTSKYYGSGGLQQVYLGLSYTFFDRLSLGVKAGYLFGDIKHNILSSSDESPSYNILWADSLRSSGLLYEVGLQYHQPIGKDKTLTIGAIYSPKIKFNGRVNSGNLVIDTSTSTIQSSSTYSTADTTFRMPQKIGVGISFSKKRHYTIGADLQYIQWADADFYNKTDSLANQLKINVGGEFIPNSNGNYFSKIRYRAGVYHSNSYINIKGEGYNEYGVSLGFGFPLVDKRSYINLALDYSAIKPQIVGMIDENYFKVTLSYTFNELWFFKRKIQ